MNKKAIILGIESSCDETAASILTENEQGIPIVLSNVVSSQIDVHSDKAAPTEAAIFDISGVQTNVAAIAADIQTVFPGNANAGSASEESKWGWMGSANSDTLSLETTDENDVRTVDLHIWKITVTL